MWAKQQEAGLEVEGYDDEGSAHRCSSFSFSFGSVFPICFRPWFGIALASVFGHSFIPRLLFCFCVRNSLLVSLLS
jgi:hypothetical protein